jgi:RimJ/RimL family protein N-acetyltransferase
MIATAAAARLPDRPRLVFLRWCLKVGRARLCAVREDERGVAVVARLDPQGTVWAVGSVTGEELLQAFERGRRVNEVRVDAEAIETARAVLTGWDEVPAIVLERRPAPPPPYEASGLRLMRTRADRHAVERLSYRFWAAAFFAFPDLPVALCFDDGNVIAVATVYAETERYVEVSIDTVAWHRREGHGFRTVAYLLEHGVPPDKWAVWTAEERNIPSLRLAERLGFLPGERVTLFRPRVLADDGVVNR